MSATAIRRVQQRLSKEFSCECRALLGARLGLKFMFGSSLIFSNAFSSADSLPSCCLLNSAGWRRFTFVWAAGPCWIRQPLVERLPQGCYACGRYSASARGESDQVGRRYVGEEHLEHTRRRRNAGSHNGRVRLACGLVDDVQRASDLHTRSEVGSGDYKARFLRPVSSYGDLNNVSLRIHD